MLLASRGSSVKERQGKKVDGGLSCIVPCRMRALHSYCCRRGYPGNLNLAWKGPKHVSETGPEPLIRVLLLIENRLLRESLGRIFRKRADFLVVGSHGNEGSSLEKVFETQCDVVVLDFLHARGFPVNLGSKDANCSARTFLLT